MSLRPKVVDFDGVFATFRAGLLGLFRPSGGPVPGMDMYQQVYDLCTARPRGHAEDLLQGISLALLEHAATVREGILSHEDIVSAYAAEWERYRTASDYANRICDFLNRHYVKRAAAHTSVQAQRVMRLPIEGHAFLIWKQRVLSDIKHTHANALISQLLSLIRRERDGDLSPSTVIRECIMSFIEINSYSENPLQLYIEEFESLYISNAVSYYMNESNSVISSVSMSKFMAKALERLLDEEERSRRYCHPSSMTKIIQACNQEYIAAHQSKIHSDFENMIIEERFEDCTRAYLLLSRIPNSVTKIIDIYEAFITRTGKQTMAQFEQTYMKEPKEYVETMTALHSKYISICVQVFRNDSAFVAAVDKAFRLIVNNDSLGPSGNAPEVFARYCDMFLKKGPKINTMSESDIDDKLTKMLGLFKYIDDKDVFQKFYTRMLAKRLIHSTSVSEDLELNVISQLKATCGYEYTSKPQRMFTDITVSSDLNNMFKEYLERSSVKLGVDNHVIVLTTGSWPVVNNPQPEFQLPIDLEQSVGHFSSFYNGHYNGRKLTWFHNLAKGDVRATVGPKPFELNVTLYQLAILLLFNNADTMTLGDITAHTRLSMDEVAKIMRNFVDMKLFLYVDGGVVGGRSDSGTRVSLNLKFVSKRARIKVAAGTQAVSDQHAESDATRRDIDEDRRLYLQAAIVRIMKSRQTLTHTMLVQEVMDQSRSRFAPSVTMIKKCIEQLIEKQFIDRVADERDRYVYVN